MMPGNAPIEGVVRPFSQFKIVNGVTPIWSPTSLCKSPSFNLCFLM